MFSGDQLTAIALSLALQWPVGAALAAGWAVPEIGARFLFGCRRLLAQARQLAFEISHPATPTQIAIELALLKALQGKGARR
jgi:hypothetical protein